METLRIPFPCPCYRNYIPIGNWKLHTNIQIIN